MKMSNGVSSKDARKKRHSLELGSHAAGGGEPWKPRRPAREGTNFSLSTVAARKSASGDGRDRLLAPVSVPTDEERSESGTMCPQFCKWRKKVPFGNVPSDHRIAI